MLRFMKIVLGVLIGFCAWFAVATAGNLLIRTLLAGYAAAEPTMQFTLAMLTARLALGGVSSVAAGVACATAVRLPGAEAFLAGVLVLFFVPIHYSLWARFPVWYHAVFLLSLAPLVLLGGALARRTGQRRRVAR